MRERPHRTTRPGHVIRREEVLQFLHHRPLAAPEMVLVEEGDRPATVVPEAGEATRQLAESLGIEQPHEERVLEPMRRRTGPIVQHAADVERRRHLARVHHAPPSRFATSTAEKKPSSWNPWRRWAPQ